MGTITAATGIRKCPKCNGRSFMNGFCLTCEHKQANAATRAAASVSLAAHAELSMRQGFKK